MSTEEYEEYPDTFYEEYVNMRDDVDYYQSQLCFPNDTTLYNEMKRELLKAIGEKYTLEQLEATFGNKFQLKDYNDISSKD